jgi:hypothetical protein
VSGRRDRKESVRYFFVAHRNAMPHRLSALVREAQRITEAAAFMVRAQVVACGCVVPCFRRSCGGARIVSAFRPNGPPNLHFSRVPGRSMSRKCPPVIKRNRPAGANHGGHGEPGVSEGSGRCSRGGPGARRRPDVAEWRT